MDVRVYKGGGMRAEGKGETAKDDGVERKDGDGGAARVTSTQQRYIFLYARSLRTYQQYRQF